MADRSDLFRGCLLGIACGDALGYTVDKKTYADICRDYGPNGLMGYDLVNGHADISSHTQLAAFSCNGLLLALTRGSSQSRPVAYGRYIALALKEWSMTQRYYRNPEKPRCWLCHVPQLRQRRCLDLRLPDTLSRDPLGTPQAPINSLNAPSSLTAAIPAGLFFDPGRMQPQEVGDLGMQAVALAHGDPLAFLSGAALAYIIAGITQEPEVSLGDHFTFAADAVAAQYSKTWPQATELQTLLRKAVFLSASGRPHPQVLDELGCDNAAGVLAGAVYAILATGGDFDASLIVSVNHSGRSAATGAVTGGILGAKLGVDSLPDFYLDCLETAPVLTEIAADLAQGSPSNLLHRLFNDDWDRKYVQGERVDPDGWATE